MKLSFPFTIPPLAIILFCFGANAETLTMSSASGAPGEIVTLTVALGENIGVAGASFTLDYDPSMLEIYDSNDPADLLPTSGVRSDFFPLFSTQGMPSDTAVSGDGVTYNKALVVNPEGTMIAAARATNGTEATTTLFEIDFRIKNGAIDGTHSVAIIPTRLYNESAGYDPVNGTEIPMLIGVDEPTSGVYEYNERNVTSNISGQIVVVGDSDSDDIPDGWERLYAPDGNDLTVFSGTGDYDNDGYSDYQEYLNDLNGETDLSGNLYNPASPNTPGGTGYVMPNSEKIKALSAIYHILLGE